MTQKLLEKPPFRYLHDILSATMGATNFATGLYSEAEMDSKAMTERDQKIDFLTKAIALTELMSGEKLEVKPAKIVAGLEADKTNIFLQAMFKCATSGVDSTPYVKQILGIDDDGGAGQNDQEAAMRAEEEERARQEEMQRQEMEAKKKRAEEKKKQQEEKKKQEAAMRKQQEEEEDRQRQEAEQEKARQKEEARAKKKQQQIQQ